jgi:hypothetical protein
MLDHPANLAHPLVGSTIIAGRILCGKGGAPHHSAFAA